MWQRRTLLHDADRIKRQETLDGCARVGNMIAEDCNIGPTGDGRSIRQAERDVLIVIEDCDFQVSIPFNKTLVRIRLQTERVVGECNPRRKLSTSRPLAGEVFTSNSPVTLENRFCPRLLHCVEKCRTPS